MKIQINYFSLFPQLTWLRTDENDYIVIAFLFWEKYWILKVHKPDSINLN